MRRAARTEKNYKEGQYGQTQQGISHFMWSAIHVFLNPPRQEQDTTAYPPAQR
jgi:hypothetical protein